VPTSESQRQSNAKHDKEHWEYITVKARKGSKERIYEAATVAGKSINGFIRDAISAAVFEELKKPLEPTTEDNVKKMLLNILMEELDVIFFKEESLGMFSNSKYNQTKTDLEEVIKTKPHMQEKFMCILTSDASPKVQVKALKKIQSEQRDELRRLIIDIMKDYVPMF